MNYLKHGILLAAAAMTLVSCNEDPWTGPAGQGGIALDLNAKGDVVDSRRTRADEDFRVPDVEEFSISLTKIENNYTRTWDKLADFRNEPGFSAGAYTLRAFYGDMEAEGFEAPCFEGSANVTVLEGRESSVSVEATLANTMVSIEYTDEFKNFFKSYSATLHSDGHGYVEYPADETRPAFLAPGEVSLMVDFTRQDGKSAKLEAASFVANPAYHYHVTVNVSGGNVGDAVLEIVFDETLVKEDVNIDLTEELFATSAPTITPVGFANGQTLDMMANTAADEPVRMDVMAFGGLKSAKLTVQSTTWAPAFDSEIELVGAAPALQSQLAAAGIKGVGFYNNADKMGVLDLTGTPLYLPEGRHSFTLVTTDKLGRVSDPMTVVFDSSPITVTASAIGAVYGSGKGEIEVDYNGKNPETAITFEVLDDYGTYKPAAVLSCTESTRTRAALAPKKYNFVIALPETTRENISVRMYLNGAVAQELTIPTIFPTYSVEVDPMATSVRFRVKGDDAATTAAVARKLRVFLSDGENVSISRDDQNGIVTVNGLTAGNVYDAKLTLHPGADPTFDYTGNFTTEAATALPNGDFSQTHETINTGKINAGGQYKITIIGTFFNYSSIIASEPVGWASINQKTCYSASAQKNTWFMVPSTYSDNGEVVIRNVAYDHNGNLPAVYNQGGAALGKYWSKNAPSSFANREAGELFLGSYLFAADQETRVDGINFTSRPASLGFDYRYSTVSEGADDNGVVEASVLDASGNVLATATRNLAPASGMQHVVLNFGNYPFGSRAANLRISFKSSKSDVAPVHVPSGDELKDIASNAPGKEITLPANQYKSLATGSVLVVDNVTLNY